MKYSLVRKSVELLDFDGDRIASASSRESGKERWTDLHLYARTDADGWVLYTVGITTVAGEYNLSDAVACVLPEDVARALLKSDSSSGARRYYLSDLALRLLVEAIDADPRLAVLDEAVEDLV